jgi:hypothetical protein
VTSKTTRFPKTIVSVIRQHARVCLCVSSLLLGLPSGAFSDSSTLTTFVVPGSLNTVVTSINEEGAIIGYYLDPISIAWRGFVRDKHGTINTFAPPGAGSGFNDRTFPLSINAEGAIAGYHMGTDGIHGFVRDRQGKFTTIDFPGVSATAALSINAGGAIAGYYLDANGTHGFVRNRLGSFTSFEVPGAPSFLPSAAPQGFNVSINEEGAIAGYYRDNGNPHGFMRDEDGNVTVISAPGASATAAVSINAEGAIAGWDADTTGVHGFVRDERGNFTAFDAAVASLTFAVSINEEGTIAGYFLDVHGSHGFVRDKGGNITTIDIPGAIAWSINDEGAVAGYAFGGCFVLKR